MLLAPHLGEITSVEQAQRQRPREQAPWSELQAFVTCELRHACAFLQVLGALLLIEAHKLFVVMFI